MGGRWPKEEGECGPVGRFVAPPRLQDAGVVTSINNSLLGYLSAQGQDSATANTRTAAKATAAGVPKAALDRAAGRAGVVSAARSLEGRQTALATDLRAAMAKAGVKLTGAIEFAVKSDGSVEIKGSDADRAATKAFLSADTSQPSFATRIATQAKDALKLSANIQQSAAISQAAKLAKTSGGVMSLYTSMMQQTAAASVVFSVSANSSSLTYPGSLSANA